MTWRSVHHFSCIAKAVRDGFREPDSRTSRGRNSLRQDIVFPDGREETDEGWWGPDPCHHVQAIVEPFDIALPVCMENAQSNARRPCHRFPSGQALHTYTGNKRSFYTSVYYLDDYADTFYGRPLVPSTGLPVFFSFNLNRFHKGSLLHMSATWSSTKSGWPPPIRINFGRGFEEYVHWGDIM